MNEALWIWSSELDLHDYNQAIWFRKEFEARKGAAGLLRITACSAYRVWLNGQWVHDGPGRSYPHRYTYDTIDLDGLLKEGTNQLEVHVRFFGIGTYLQVDVHAGLLAELELPGQVIRTDATWSAAVDRRLHRWVPKLSAQSEPCELIDSRLSDLSWHPARELFKGEDGAWKNLTACPARRASTSAVRPVKIVSANRLLNRRPYHCVPVNLLVNPGLIESNTKVSRPVVLTAILNATETVDFSWDSED